MIEKKTGERNKNSLLKNITAANEKQVDNLIERLEKVTGKIRNYDITQDLIYDEDLMTEDESQYFEERRFIYFDKTQKITPELIKNKHIESQAKTYEEFLLLTQDLKKSQIFNIGEDHAKNKNITDEYTLMEVIKIGEMYLPLEIKNFDTNNNTREISCSIYDEVHDLDIRDFNEKKDEFMKLAEKISSQYGDSPKYLINLMETLSDISKRSFNDANILEGEAVENFLNQSEESNNYIKHYDNARKGFIFENNSDLKKLLHKEIAESVVKSLSEEEAIKVNTYGKNKKDIQRPKL